MCQISLAFLCTNGFVTLTKLPGICISKQRYHHLREAPKNKHSCATRGAICSCPDQDSLRPGILELSRPRLFETKNFGVFETETS